MPHIAAEGCNTERQISQINIHVNVKFSSVAWQNQVKCNQRINELQEKIDNLLLEYFDISELTGDTYTNHEWNTRMNNF